jgi:hypothetical protein
MAAETTITCPNCRSEVKLTESLAAPLVEATRRHYEEQLALKDAAAREKETLLKSREAALDKQKNAIDAEVAQKLEIERKKMAESEAKKAKLALQSDLDQKAKELADFEAIIRAQNEKLTKAQEAEAAFRKKERELEDARREIDLTIEKRLAVEQPKLVEKAKKDAEESLNLKVAERDERIASMAKQIDELKRKAEQGSQQLQGEVLELELEKLLTSRYPRDTIEPVPKGVHGGDVVHKVLGPLGACCGTILWESKRTKNWSDGWLAKLRDDQRAAKAELCVIVSQALPKDVEHFDCIENVMIVHPRILNPVADLLRQRLIEVSLARSAGEGQQTKMEMIYDYLTGPRFRQRIEAIVEAFTTMQEDLDRERRAIMRQWGKREEQIERVMQATVGMYGDLQGIAGKSIQEIEGLEVLSLE